MDWNLLKTFLAIAQHGTLAGASRELGINHSTVFRRLNCFEEEIGSRLFERMNGGYQLTDAGEALYKRGGPIADAFDQLERHIVGQDYKPQGKIRLTAPENIAIHYLPDYLSSFQQLYPEVMLELIVSGDNFNLTKREADIALRATANPPEHLVGRKVNSINWAVYASEQHTGPLPTVMSELSAYSIIGGEGQISQLPAFQWLDKHCPESQVIKCNNLNTIAALTETGMAISLLPDDQQRSGIQRLFQCEAAWLSDLWILTHPDLRQVERIRLLMQHLYESIQNDVRLRN